MGQPTNCAWGSFCPIAGSGLAGERFDYREFRFPGLNHKLDIGTADSTVRPTTERFACFLKICNPGVFEILERHVEANTPLYRLWIVGTHRPSTTPRLDIHPNSNRPIPLLP